MQSYMKCLAKFNKNLTAAQYIYLNKLLMTKVKSMILEIGDKGLKSTTRWL